MKKIFAMLVTVLSLKANAVVTDQFKCKLELTDTKSKTTATREEELFIARIPVANDWGVDVKSTSARSQVKLNLRLKSGEELSATFHLNFDHAMKVGADGSILKAKQSNCNNLEVHYCRFPSDPNCSVSHISCISTNPFDDIDDGFIDNWNPVSVTNGVPAYLESTLGPISAITNDHGGRVRGMATFQCRYLGTYN